MLYNGAAWTGVAVMTGGNHDLGYYRRAYNRWRSGTRGRVRRTDAGGVYTVAQAIFSAGV